MGKRGMRRMARTISLPEDALTKGARVTMIGRGSVLVEGQRGVVELSRRRIRLKTQDGMLSVLGQALELRELSADAAMIVGEQIETATYARIDAQREG
ncbi:MAG: YabP/YqfC family sporulation protein [Candidatus Ventricola sp.]